jgi:precorrin-3B synthase
MNAPPRRGACPGLSAPMQTGDGLLVRLLPIGTISLDAFSELCAAARTFGNGIVEITARGSIQVRGLSAASAPPFAAAVGTLGIAAEDGVPVQINPLAGLDPDEILDARAVAADLRRALVDHKLAMHLLPKVCVTVDGGGALTLDRLSADVRLCAEATDGAVQLRVSIGGDEASATHLGFIAPTDGVTAAIRLIDVIAQRGRDARAKDIILKEGAAPFSAAIADVLQAPHESCRDMSRHDAATSRREIVGPHRLRDGALAFGLGLAFGHVKAMSLENLVEVARARGATGMRTAPGRGLFVIGLAHKELTAFAAAAEGLGFITRADDPRRYVFACAGAPFCASGHIAARTIAPAVAKVAAQFLGDSFSIHLSGCAKGCAHPGPAALTILGTREGCGLIANGTARDAPFAVVTNDEMMAEIAKCARQLCPENSYV